jgi:hypothetical protein
MTKAIVSPEFHLSFNQPHHLSLSRRDRRILLGASLRLLARRFSCGRPVLRADLARLFSFADDVERRDLERAGV